MSSSGIRLLLAPTVHCGLRSFDGILDKCLVDTLRRRSGTRIKKHEKYSQFLEYRERYGWMSW